VKMTMAIKLIHAAETSREAPRPKMDPAIV
jgi:hypothetical protein